MKFKPRFTGNPGECSWPLSGHFFSSFLVFTCLLGISMWLFNRHFRIKWPTHNFDFLTCPCLVFLFSVNGLTIWPVIQTKSLTFTLPSFFSLLPCQTYPQVPSTVSLPPATCLFASSALGQASTLSLLATVTAAPLGYLCPSLLPCSAFLYSSQRICKCKSPMYTPPVAPLCSPNSGL